MNICFRPCLLFRKGKSNRTSAGFDDLQSFEKRNEKRHESSIVAKILSLKDLKVFGKNLRIAYSMSDRYMLSIERTYKQVRKDSAVLVHLMHIFCVLENLVLAFRTSINRGNYF
jgi:hypothetical protein